MRAKVWSIRLDMRRAVQNEMAGTLTPLHQYEELFAALDQAELAFGRLMQRGGMWSDQELARDADYLQLHKLGLQIALIGGEPAIRAARKSILRAYNGETENAQEELERFWNGMGSWSYEPSEGRFQS